MAGFWIEGGLEDVGIVESRDYLELAHAQLECERDQRPNQTRLPGLDGH